MGCVEFSVPGKPFGKQRPRVVNVGGYSRAYTPKETATYENLVKVMYQQATANLFSHSENQSSKQIRSNWRFADNTPLEAEITAYYEIPKSTSKKKRAQMLSGEIRPTKKPDLDNIEKIICDSLNGIAYKDDSQIVKCTVIKVYGEVPRVDVKIYEVKRGGIGNDN